MTSLVLCDWTGLLWNKLTLFFRIDSSIKATLTYASWKVYFTSKTQRFPPLRAWLTSAPYWEIHEHIFSETVVSTYGLCLSVAAKPHDRAGRCTGDRRRSSVRHRGFWFGTGNKAVQEGSTHLGHRPRPLTLECYQPTMQINEATIKQNTLDENHAKHPCAISAARVYRRLGWIKSPALFVHNSSISLNDVRTQHDVLVNCENGSVQLYWHLMVKWSHVKCLFIHPGNPRRKKGKK